MQRTLARKLIAALLFAVFLVGCSGNATPPQSPPTTSEDPATSDDSGLPTGEVNLTLFVFAAPGHKDVPRQVVEQYMEKHKNVKIEIIESSNAKVIPEMLAAHQTTPDNPPIHIGYYNLDSTMKGLINGLWEPLNPENIPNLAGIDPQFRQEDELGVLFVYGPYGLIYNKEKVQEPPTSYADLWSNPAFKGRVGLWDYQFAPIVLAARMNGGGEDNIEPGIQAFADNADQIHSLFTSNEQLKNGIATGDIWLSFFDMQQATIWAEEGVPVGIAVPEEGAVAWPLYIQVTQGVTPEQKRVAEDLINELIAPEVLAAYAEATYYVPTNPNVELSEKVLSLPSFQPEVIENAISLDFLKMSENNEEWSKLWDREVKTKLSR